MNKDSDIESENSRPDLRFYASDQSKDAYADVDKAREDVKLSTSGNYAPKYAKWAVADDGSTATFSWTSDANLPSEKFTIKITVKSKDGGSFGTLQASFNGNATINIPKDDNGNYIADKSDTKYGYTNPALDNEKGPTGQLNTVENNTQIGDGLVDFEEYRGIEAGGEHTRLSPTKKDIFIVSDFSTFDSDGLATSGIGYASNLPSSVFSKHEIKASETKVNPDNLERTVNFNSLGRPVQYGAGSDWRVMNKEVISIEKDTTVYQSGHANYHLLGTSWPASMRVRIYSKNIDRVAGDVIGRSQRRGFNWADVPEAKQEILKRTLGHEIGHVMGLKHPWEVKVNGTLPAHDELPDNISLSDSPSGWVGLHAYDNAGIPRDFIISKAKKVYNNWRWREDLALKLDDPEAYRAKEPYQIALKNLNLYLVKQGDGTFKVRRLSYVAGRSKTATDVPFTYSYGSSIMDYSTYYLFTNDNKVHGILNSTSYPVFHNWEYDLNVPQNRDKPDWTPRPNPVPVPCGGAPADQPEQTPTPPPNDGTQGTNTPPDQPYGLSYSIVDGQFRLSWTDGGGTVTGFQYQYRVPGGS